jgi:hypothetical protein
MHSLSTVKGKKRDSSDKSYASSEPYAIDPPEIGSKDIQLTW